MSLSKRTLLGLCLAVAFAGINVLLSLRVIEDNSNINDGSPRSLRSLEKHYESENSTISLEAHSNAIETPSFSVDAPETKFLLRVGTENKSSAESVAADGNGSWLLFEPTYNEILDETMKKTAPLPPPPSNSIRTNVWKVYEWTKGVQGGIRERLYNKEGWNAHPNTTIVDSPDEADIIVWVTTMGRVQDEIPPSNYSNVIVLDYADGCSVHPRRKDLKHEIGYFKRSFVRRKNGVFINNCSASTGTKMIRPYAYSGIQALLPTKEEPPLAFQQRPLELINSLRSEGYHNVNRKRIVDWTNEYVESRSLANSSYYIGEVGHGLSRNKWHGEFMAQMGKSKIVVTCNPFGWEGDHRLWEALMSGALVFVDKMAILDWMPYPLSNGTHFVMYDSENQSNFDSLLDYYRSHPMESERIADAGYQHVVQHHMPRNRIEYILENVEIKTTKKTTPLPPPPPPPPPAPPSSSRHTGVWKVYEWTKGVQGGVRERLYNKEGWNAHPNTTIVDSPEEADIIVWVTTMGRVHDEIPPSNYSNVIVLDYADGSNVHPRRKDLNHEIGYFKRSFVRRKNGVFIGNCSGTTGTKMVRPYAYSGIQALLPTKEGPPLAFQQRPLELINSLRVEGYQGYNNVNRKRIVNWTNEYVESRSLANTSYYIGEVGRGLSRQKWHGEFMTQMRKSKIVVTCNPGGKEGDFRLWEALMSGALVFVDKMVILDWMPYPLVNGTHFVMYDSENQSNFDSLLDYYRSHPMESERIADAGYQHVVQHHMPRNRIEYVLENVEIEV